jgi:hypothetical protein
MSSTHEPPQLLEPSNLLEPLDLNQHGDFADPSARGERGERGPRTQPQFTRGKPRVRCRLANDGNRKSVFRSAR